MATHLQKLGDSPSQTQKEAGLLFDFGFFFGLNHSDCGNLLQYPQKTIHELFGDWLISVQVRYNLQTIQVIEIFNQH